MSTRTERTARYFDSITRLGFTYTEADKIRLIEKTLSRWSELECGESNDYASWAIERDETTGKPYHVTYPHNGKSSRHRIADREAGALRRLRQIMANYPHLWFYHQGDPRGCAVYIGRKGDLPKDAFQVVRSIKGTGWTIKPRDSEQPYAGAGTKARAIAFAAHETLSSNYTRGVAACIDQR